MKFEIGDATLTTSKYLLHGCNCVGVMGAGIAKTIKDKFPHAFQVYIEQKNSTGLILGDYSISRMSSPIIVNLLTQQSFGREDKVYADLNAISKSVTKFISDEFHSWVAEDGKILISMPRIGCGLGGLSWVDVEKVFMSIEKANAHKIEFVIYDFIS